LDTFYSPAPNGMYQERKSLLERIECFESSARYFNGDRCATGGDAADRHIEYAKARLERIDDMIAGAERSIYA
jgi:hypothetical protein